MAKAKKKTAASKRKSGDAVSKGQGKAAAGKSVASPATDVRRGDAAAKTAKIKQESNVKMNVKGEPGVTQAVDSSTADADLWDYMYREWGKVERDDCKLFEQVCLQGAQAGLNWTMILRKRQGYRAAFRDFDIAKVARFTDADLNRLLQDPGIIRNRLKISATINNARVIQTIQKEHGSFSGWLEAQVTSHPSYKNYPPLNSVFEGCPSTNAGTAAITKDLSKAMKKEGFKFVGPMTLAMLLHCTAFLPPQTPEYVKKAKLEAEAHKRKRAAKLEAAVKAERPG